MILEDIICKINKSKLMEEYKHHIDTRACVCVHGTLALVGVVVKGGEVFKQPPPLSDGRRCPACLFICTR